MNYESHSYQASVDPYTGRRSTKAIFEDITKLISLAEESNNSLQYAKNALLKIKIYLAWGILIAFVAPLFIVMYALRSNNVQLLNLTTGAIIPLLLVVFFFGLFFILPKLKNLNLEIKIERESLREIMEIIFNLKSMVENRHEFDVVAMTILELRLKRMYFH
jgi:hypothetical protein